MDWNGPNAVGTETYEAFVRTLPGNSDRLLATEEVSVEVGDDNGNGDNGDDDNGDDDNGDDENGDDPDDSGGLLSFLSGLSQRQKLALGAGVGGVLLLSQRRGGTSRRR